MKSSSSKKYYLFEMKMVPINVLSFFLLFLMIGITYVIDKDFFVSSFNDIFDSYALFLILIILYMVLHEILHSISYCIYGGKFKNIIYGIELEKGVFYCLCKQNVNKLNILNSLFFPLFYIGVVTYIIGMLFELPILVWLSIFNINGCSGDIIMFIFMSRLSKDIEFTEFDDPTSFAIYSSEDVSKYNHFGLKYKGCFDKVGRNNFKKINITKFSYGILALFLLLILVFVFI